MKPTNARQVATKEKQCEIGLLLLHLPLCLIYEIFSWLPADTIFSCICVCRTFRDILRNPYFAQLHLSKAPYRDPNLIIQNATYATKIYMGPIHDLEKNDHLNFYYSLWQTLTTVPSSIPILNCILSIVVGSCNGVLCLKYVAHGVAYLYVCNPLLGEFMLLPKLERALDLAMGFGFCPNTKKYKVIRFPEHTTCKIHTLGTDDWRTIENVPSARSFTFDSSFNGNLHWITVSDLICAFSLETERCSYITPPARLNILSIVRIGTLDGMFCVWYLFRRDVFEVYVMKDYGVATSWTKAISVDLSSIFGPFIRIPLRFLDNGALLFRQFESSLIYYNIRNGVAKRMLSNKPYDAISHVPSFVSLRSIVGETMVEVVQRDRVAVSFLPSR